VDFNERNNPYTHGVIASCEVVRCVSLRSRPY